ncbi:MAG: metallophosphoesterase [Methanobacterium sp.]|uniref:metallophosphoesterase n=1 Tax=Methanobacterium sp. TaxID=2164 RepID=UPI003D64BE45|nr:metallophosphoesterase [Methanobacterium sp.]
MKKKSSDLKKFRIRQKLQKTMSNSMEKMGLYQFNSGHFDVVNINVNIHGMDNVFDGFRIAQITDIHLGQWMSKDRLKGVMQLVNEENPDIIAITGDFVSYDIDNIINDLKYCLTLLKPNIASLAVLGNHDHWLGADKIRKVLKESKIVDISNDTYTVKRDGVNLHFAGVDSVTLNKHRLDLIIEKLPESGPAILLAHEPDFADISSTTGRFSLQISGHSHGGQFIIPGIGTFIRGPNFLKYPVGKYQVGDMIQYTNRGLGTNIFWFRINCPPEITIFNLKSE